MILGLINCGAELRGIYGQEAAATQQLPYFLPIILWVAAVQAPGTTQGM